MMNSQFDEVSVKVHINKSFCYTIDNDENLEDIKDNFIRYSMKLTDMSGQPMNNKIIHVYSSIGDYIVNKITITNEPSGGQDFKIIPPVTSGDNIFVPIPSDPEGNVNFRVYSKNDVSSEIKLGAELPGENIIFSVPDIYIISHKPSDQSLLISRAIIPDLDDGNLSAYGSNLTFDVKVPNYDNPSDGDTVLFFTKENNGNYFPSVKKIREPFSNYYDSQLYYDDFDINKPSELYYVVVTVDGRSLYSEELNFIYIGGGSNKPSGNINRIFDKPIIYSSWANPKSNPPLNKDDDNYIRSEGYYINSEDIYNYRKNGGYGLFIKIVGTKDESDTHKPKFGDTINLTMYVNGGIYNKEGKHEKDVKNNKKIPCVISDIPDSHDGNTSTTVIYIDYESVVELSKDFNNNIAMIYFEYYVSDEGARKYSNLWSSQIETIGSYA
ncbi:hypothetical protein [Xenorhabdus littoralis]|uniref:hypothetical protein n=1 Tax=Xenorhabdus littoralis TaxID=2582835 RepID=UPI0029E811CB|nr:hypothetical protein [Xenorhabdus sp. psl]MDX7992126.1 hypothetical protein [Xenorhabdus sp. psl]